MFNPKPLNVYQLNTHHLCYLFELVPDQFCWCVRKHYPSERSYIHMRVRTWGLSPVPPGTILSQAKRCTSSSSSDLKEMVIHQTRPPSLIAPWSISGAHGHVAGAFSGVQESAWARQLCIRARIHSFSIWCCRSSSVRSDQTSSLRSSHDWMSLGRSLPCLRIPSFFLWPLLLGTNYSNLDTIRKEEKEKNRKEHGGQQLKQKWILAMGRVEIGLGKPAGLKML